jgi:hypothetical protein
MILRSPHPDVEIPDVPLAGFVLSRAGELGDKPALIDGPSGRGFPRCPGQQDEGQEYEWRGQPVVVARLGGNEVSKSLLQDKLLVAQGANIEPAEGFSPYHHRHHYHQDLLAPSQNASIHTE